MTTPDDCVCTTCPEIKSLRKEVDALTKQLDATKPTEGMDDYAEGYHQALRDIADLLKDMIFNAN